jgi:hypothetical protein
VLSYLVEPMQGYGDVEQNGQRRVALKIRNTTTAWDGY